MLSYLNHQLQQHFPNQEEFLIALSGGVDSVMLLHLFAQLNLKVRAIHVHHGLSPNADQWVTFCQQLCRQWHIPLEVKYVNVSGEKGIEASAREARYQAIRESRKPNEVVVTAHHLNDQVETFFLALKRGAGLKGLSAMQAVSFSQKFTLFRPLLSVSKAEILDYAQAHQLNWVEDESNQSNLYERNFLRNHWLPEIEQQWAYFPQNVARACQHLTSEQKLLNELLSDVLARYFEPETNTLAIHDFAAFSAKKQTALLRLWLEKSGLLMPTSAQLQQLIERVILAEADKNPQLKLGEWVIRRYQQKLFITPELAKIDAFSLQIEQNKTLLLPYQLGEIQYSGQELICKKSDEIHRLQLPHDHQNQLLTICIGYSGKVLEYGKTHHEEIKKIWQKYQIPVWLRDRTPLVFAGNILIGLL
nr:tRNA lysidine(34) synthetase TilS [uncultured Haemophilus sp.]